MVALIMRISSHMYVGGIAMPREPTLHTLDPNATADFLQATYRSKGTMPTYTDIFLFCLSGFWRHCYTIYIYFHEPLRNDLIYLSGP